MCVGTSNIPRISTKKHIGYPSGEVGHCSVENCRAVWTFNEPHFSERRLIQSCRLCTMHFGQCQASSAVL